MKERKKTEKKKKEVLSIKQHLGSFTFWSCDFKSKHCIRPIKWIGHEDLIQLQSTYSHLLNNYH